MASNVEFYDSSMKAKSIERDFSNIVETPVPKDGKTLDAMYRFHKRYGIAPRIGQEWRDEHGRDYIRCFAVPIIAVIFKNEFGVR